MRHMAEPADPPAERIEIGLDRIVEILRAGVRRTAIFMGLGVNAALDPDFNQAALPSSVSNLQLVPDIPAEHMPEVKREFAIWIQAGGFRELCECIEQYLTAIYRVGSYMRASRGGRISSSAVVGVPKDFLRKGISIKLEKLRTDFQIEAGNPKHLGSLWDARNCLTHRRGIVGAEDAGDDGILRVKWLAVDTLFIGDDGIETPMGVGFAPFNTGGGGNVCVRVVERVREFRLGEQLVLSPHDLNEICWFCLRSSDEVVASLLRFAELQGVQVLQTGDPPAAPADEVDPTPD